MQFSGCGTDGAQPTDGALDNTHDGFQPGDVKQADGIGVGNIGAPCDPKNEGKGCSGQTTCLDVVQENPLGGTGCNLSTGEGCGVCTVSGCTLEDSQTVAIEDNCPQIVVKGKTYRTICTAVPVSNPEENSKLMNFCLPQCTPDVTRNVCQDILGHGGLACDPTSILLNSQSEVCLFAACSSNNDCNISHPLEPEARCHPSMQICLNNGSNTGTIGRPCTESKECGPNQICYPEVRDTEGNVFVEGGYCTLIGCKYYKNGDTETAHWECPAKSKCFLMGTAEAVSFCLDIDCDVSQPPGQDGCRDETQEGQFSCTKIGSDNVCWITKKTKSK